MAKRISTSRNTKAKPDAARRRTSAKATEAVLATVAADTDPAKRKPPRRGKAADDDAGRPGNRLARTSPSMADAPLPQRLRARIRMYRHGLGDCFLVFLPKAAAGSSKS